MNACKIDHESSIGESITRVIAKPDLVNHCMVVIRQRLQPSEVHLAFCIFTPDEGAAFIVHFCHDLSGCSVDAELPWHLVCSRDVHGRRLNGDGEVENQVLQLSREALDPVGQCFVFQSLHLDRSDSIIEAAGDGGTTACADESCEGMR